MSLQVWLPLNGNLNNQGLSNITFTNENSSTIAINDNGKIGKCYTRASAKTNGRIIANQTINLNSDLSMCCWAKVTATVGDTANGLVSCHSHSDNTGFGITVKQISTSDYRISCSTGNGSGRTYYTYYGTTNIKDTWHHLALTYNHTKKEFQLWVDSIVEKTQSYTNASKADYIEIFEWSTSYNDVNYRPACSLNDVRIYDHCLSAKEVEEIAKGLVLHYSLDNNGIVPNLLLDTNVSSLTKVNAAYNRYYESSSSGTYTMTWENLTDSPLPSITYGLREKVTTVSGFHSVTWYSGGLVSVIVGEIYTMSCYVKRITGTDLKLRFQYGKSPYVADDVTIINDDQWHQYSWTFVPNDSAAANGTTKIYCGGLMSIGEILICGWKLELGNKATPWSYHKDELLGLTSNIVYDSSGYGNHGNILSNLELSSDTPRYNCSSIFNGIDSGILIENLQLSSIINTAITYSFWIKPNGENGARSVYFGSYSGTSWSIEKTASNLIRCYWNGSPDLTCSGASISDDIWQHVCITKNGTSDLKVYINGIQKYTNTTVHNTLSFPTTYRIGRDTRSGDGTPYHGLISDFRIYCTALTADQVKDLYEDAHMLDNKGNLYTRELIEI